MKNSLFVILVTAFLLFVGLTQVARAQENQRPFPIVSSTLDKPFEIIRSISHMEVINTEQGILGLSTENAIIDAYNKGFSALESFAKKSGADAVINTSYQILLIPGRGKVGIIYFFGTLVKVKDGPK